MASGASPLVGRLTEAEVDSPVIPDRGFCLSPYSGSMSRADPALLLQNQLL
jgi:hypothetical protein